MAYPIGVTFVAMSVYSSDASCAADDEGKLREGLLDLLALTRSEPDFSDFKRAVNELILVLDRYVRRGGKNSRLVDTANQCIKIKSDWELFNSTSSEYQSEKAHAEQNSARDERMLADKFNAGALSEGAYRAQEILRAQAADSTLLKIIEKWREIGAKRKDAVDKSIASFAEQMKQHDGKGRIDKKTQSPAPK